jgi:transcriptional regulator with XRE-family HTH domain
MATVKDWLNQKFNEWEKAQGGRQSYYAFARYLEVSQSGLGQWMAGSAAPAGDDVLNLANKLGPEVYDVLGLPRPNVELQRLTISYANLPADIRQNLSSAVSEADAALRQQRLRPDSADARKIVIEILAKWGFRYGK